MYYYDLAVGLVFSLERAAEEAMRELLRIPEAREVLASLEDDEIRNLAQAAMRIKLITSDEKLGAALRVLTGGRRRTVRRRSATKVRERSHGAV